MTLNATSVTQEMNPPHLTPNLTWFGCPSLQNCKKIDFYCLKAIHPVPLCRRSPNGLRQNGRQERVSTASCPPLVKACMEPGGTLSCLQISSCSRMVDGSHQDFNTAEAERPPNKNKGHMVHLRKGAVCVKLVDSTIRILNCGLERVWGLEQRVSDTECDSWRLGAAFKLGVWG